MGMNLKVRYFHDGTVLCFRHAMVKAINGEHIETKVDDFGKEKYLGKNDCETCQEKDNDWYDDDTEYYSQEPDIEEEDLKEVEQKIVEEPKPDYVIKTKKPLRKFS